MPSMVTSGLGAGGKEAVTTAHVAAFGGQRHHQRDFGHGKPTMMVAGTMPALVALQQNMKTPYFDGDERRWPQFARDWHRYVAYMLIGAPDGAMGDVWKRDLLVNCLHSVLSRRYQTMILARPGLQFSDVWRDLEKNFAIDDPHHWRLQWDRVELQHAGEAVRLKDWLFFQAEFEAAKAMVSDWTEQEELDLLLKRLPPGWRTKVLREEAKEARRKFSVKITGCIVGGEKLKNIMMQLGARVKAVKDQANCSIISFVDEASFQLVMDLKDLTIGGRRVGLQAVRDRWTANKIFEHIAAELRLEQESRVLGGWIGKPRFGEPSRERAAAVVEQRPGDGGRSTPHNRGGSPHRAASGSSTSPGQRSHTPNRRPSTPSKTSPAGSGKAQWQKGPRCNTCTRAGRDAAHSWLKCEHAKAEWMKRTGKQPPTAGDVKPSGQQHQRK